MATPEEIDKFKAVAIRQKDRCTRAVRAAEDQVIALQQKLADYKANIEQKIALKNERIQHFLSKKQLYTDKIRGYGEGTINLSETKQLAFRRAYRDRFDNPPDGVPHGSPAAKTAAIAAGVSAAVATKQILGGRRRRHRYKLTTKKKLHRRLKKAASRRKEKKDE